MHPRILKEKCNSKIDASRCRMFFKNSQKFEISPGNKSTGKPSVCKLRMFTKTVENKTEKLFSNSLRAQRCFKIAESNQSESDDFETPKRKKHTTGQKVTTQKITKQVLHGSSLKTKQDQNAPNPSSCSPATSTYDPSDLSCDQWLLLKPKLPHSVQHYVGRSVEEVSRRLQDTCMSIQLEGLHKENNMTSHPPVFLQRNLKSGEKTVQKFLNKIIKIHGQKQHNDIPEQRTPAQEELSQDNNGTTHAKIKRAAKSKQNISVSDTQMCVREPMETANAALKEGVLSNFSDDPSSVGNDTNIQPDHSCQRQHVSQIEGQKILNVVSKSGSSSLAPSKVCTNAEQLNNNTDLLSIKTLLSRKREKGLPTNNYMMETPTSTHLDSDIKQTLGKLPKDSEIADTGNKNNRPFTLTLRPRKIPNNQQLSGDGSHCKHVKEDDTFEAIHLQTSGNAQSAKWYRLHSHNKTYIKLKPCSVSLRRIKNMSSLTMNSTSLKQHVPADYIVADKDDTPILQNNGSKTDTQDVAIASTGVQDNGNDNADPIPSSRQVQIDSRSLDVQDETFTISQKPFVAGPFRSLFFSAIGSKRNMVWSIVDEN